MSKSRITPVDKFRIAALARSIIALMDLDPVDRIPTEQELCDAQSLAESISSQCDSLLEKGPAA